MRLQWQGVRKKASENRARTLSSLQDLRRDRCTSVGAGEQRSLAAPCPRQCSHPRCKIHDEHARFFRGGMKKKKVPRLDLAELGFVGLIETVVRSNPFTTLASRLLQLFEIQDGAHTRSESDRQNNRARCFASYVSKPNFLARASSVHLAGLDLCKLNIISRVFCVKCARWPSGPISSRCKYVNEQRDRRQPLDAYEDL